MVNKVKLFKLLLASVAVFSTGAKAELSVLTESLIQHEVEDGFVGIRAAKRNQKDLIADAAVHAAAAYNDTTLVNLKSHAMRKQTGFADRELLVDKGHDIASFSANIPGRGDVPAGIVTYKENPEGRAQITVAFHGSESREDFIEANVRAFKKQNPAIGIKGYMHGGFSDRYDQSREALLAIIENRLAAHGKTADDVDFRVTGHSLGGALATLGAADIKTNLAKNAKVDLVTFSSPRVFDPQGAQEMENLLGDNRMVRIWREGDLVPALSLGARILNYVPVLNNFVGFKHVGLPIQLESVSAMPLKNHLFGTIREDAVSDKPVKFVANPVGYGQWFGAKVSSLKSVVSSGLQKAKSLFWN